MKRWENGIIPPVSFSKENHATEVDGLLARVRKKFLEPISGWLSLEGGKLAERPLGK
jgi:hypothetical protein